MYLVLIFCAVISDVFSQSTSLNSQLKRCKTPEEHSGLCVPGRLCRVRTIKLAPCDTGDRALFCCPFPTNKTIDWSLEDRGAAPIVFPSDVSGNSKGSVEETDDDYESVEIVFPAEDGVQKDFTYKPIGTNNKGTSPTRYPQKEVSTTSKIYMNKRHPFPEIKPKIPNQTLERNPNENNYGIKEFDVERQIPFELIPIPKTTTPKPTQKFTELTKIITTPRTTSTTYISSTTYSSTIKKDDPHPDLPVTSTANSAEKVTYGPIENVTANKAFDTACGRAAFSPNIAGGTESKPNKWPWMAAIFQRFTTARPNKFLCGGSLINTRYILTAAHCCVSGASSVALPASSFLVRMGSGVLNEGDNFSIAKVRVHYNFSFTGQFNDIALLRLTADLPSYTNRIAPICLPYPTLLDADLVDDKATVAGWGSTYLGGAHQELLHEVTVPIVSIDDCALAYSRIKSAAFLARGSTHVLCAGLKEGGKDSCKSDSGGPLMFPLSNDSWTIIGIVSFGYRCAEPGFPGVYTRVTHYLEWIYGNTQD